MGIIVIIRRVTNDNLHEDENNVVECGFIVLMTLLAFALLTEAMNQSIVISMTPNQCCKTRHQQKISVGHQFERSGKLGKRGQKIKITWQA